ncbi:unnamed protein product [Cylicocyclus nassatus]|uniref:Uncharacterized protein n=1 Tax=Cylicocyclus nassatus TaxID=53992 RepID=A0AA36H041_CYLNA|nr:unnamed protein product [Cylicocyclus nassatus]
MKEEAQAFYAIKNASELEELIVYHKVNIKLGALCSALSLLLLYCLLSNKYFRRTRKLIIALAFADLMNCVGILLMGVDRSLLYYNIIHVGQVNLETSWSCARQFWLLVKTTGTKTL